MPIEKLIDGDGYEFVKNYKEITIEIPLDWELSKNRKFIGRTKKVLNPKYKKIKEWISWAIRAENLEKKIIFDKNKIWIKILVFKGLRGDAHNLIEGILDAIKTEIEVDDNYYSVLCDYEISKSRKIIISIQQIKSNEK
jgi:hypothetical protein